MSIPLSDFAKAAIEHALDRHSIQLREVDLSSIDVILDRQRELGSTCDHNSLVLCYGAWLGEFICRRVGGEWVGLNEPTPPRVRVGGVDYSPLDAVARRLAEETAPRIEELVERLRQASREMIDAVRAGQINQAAWDQLSSDPRFTASQITLMNRSQAPAALDPWLTDNGSLKGQRVLCLAAGGGTHGPLFASAGAQVTVVDFSKKLLALDQQIALTNGLMIETIKTSMEDLSMIPDATFDCVVQPVSFTYIPNLSDVYSEVHRVLKPNGLYVSQHKQPFSLQAESVFHSNGYRVSVPNAEGLSLLPTALRSINREHETVEFIHTLDAILGGLCRHGFIIEDFHEPPRGDAWAPLGSAEHRATFLPPYLKVKARRTGC
jgi:ubiquinone/menaquinone biosynthesis C-methylase UbiE